MNFTNRFFIQDNEPISTISSIPTAMKIEGTNHDYQSIAQNFLEKYINTHLLGFGYIDHFYEIDVLCSLYLHHNNSHQLYELRGYQSYKNKLQELGAGIMKHRNAICLAQPVGRISILISFFGEVEINMKLYKSETILIVKLQNGSGHIINQVTNIFM